MTDRRNHQPGFATRAIHHGDNGPLPALALDIGCGSPAGHRALIGYVIHQVMHMQYVATSKNAGNICLQCIVNHSARGGGAELNTCAQGQLIFRNQANGQKQGIAVEILLCPRDRPAILIHPGYSHALKTLPSADVGDRMA